MSEDKKRKRRTDNARRRFGRFWSVSVIFTIVAIICCLVWKISSWHSRSVDEQFAAIYADRAIPESEDAGVAYRKLAEGRLSLPDGPLTVDRQTRKLTSEKPWSSKDFPKLAAWLDERQDLLSKLLDISKMEKCRFLILSDIQRASYVNNPVRQMGGWVSLLVRSANMDAGEGRIDAAIEKYACVLQMGSHLRQQPVVSYYEFGVGTELMALIRMEELVNQTELTEMQLTAIEAALLPAQNEWKHHSKIMVKVQRLFEQKLIERTRRPRIIEWRRYWAYRRATSKSKASSKSDGHLLQRTHRYHISTLTKRRRMLILIALRRFKTKTGHWPRSLGRIEPPLSKETLTDPRNNTPFIYELTGDDFELHSKGES